MKKLSCILFLLIPVILFGQYNLKKTGIPYREGNKWGYVDYITKDILVAPVYDSVSYLVGYSNEIPIVYNNNKIGLIDDTGHLIITPDNDFDYISKFPDYGDKNLAWLAGYYRGKKKLYNLDGSKLLDSLYENILSINDSLVLIGNNFLFGIYDIKNKIEYIKPLYEGFEINSTCTNEKYNRFCLENIIFMDKSKQTFKIDSFIKLISFSISEDCLNQDYFYGGIPMRMFSNFNLKQLDYIIDGKPMPKKTYTTTKGNKYELTNKHFKQYQLIKDKTSNQFGLIENTDPNTQLVRLEPIYSNINLMNHKIVKLLAIIENENKFGLYDLFSLKEIVMPIYDSIRFDQNDNQYFD
jgi:hypothetical protein